MLAPEHQTVVETKRKYSADSQQKPISAHVRKLNVAQANDDVKNGAGDYKPDACKGEWRQISETELNKKPGRSPDATENQPNETGFHCRLPISERRFASLFPRFTINRHPKGYFLNSCPHSFQLISL